MDAIAGVVTQRSLALDEGEKVRDRHGLPIKLLMGQMEKESGYLLGNHTARYEANGSYDLGVCQINNEAKKLTVATCFDVPYAINFLAEEMREKHDRYLTAPLRTGARRVENRQAWRLAAGSWNRPAHTAYLAGMQGDDPVAPSSRVSDGRSGGVDSRLHRAGVHILRCVLRCATSLAEVRGDG